MTTTSMVSWATVGISHLGRAIPCLIHSIVAISVLMREYESWKVYLASAQEIGIFSMNSCICVYATNTMMISVEPHVFTSTTNDR